MDKKIVFSIASAAYIILLLIGSLIVKPNSLMPSSSFDWLLHIVGFAILAMLIFFTLKFYNLKGLISLSLSFSIFIAFVVESLRMPGRGFSFLDLLFDLIGIFVTMVLIWLFYNR